MFSARRRGRRRCIIACRIWLLLLLLPLLRLDLMDYSAWESLFTEWEDPAAQHPLLLNTLMESRTDSGNRDVWDPPENDGWGPCNHELGDIVETTGKYLQVFLEGGLNQQRMGICDAVAVAKILNATLVIPHLDLNPVWLDSSTFADIYDVDHFINSLASDVKIVKILPQEYDWSTREYYATGVRATRIKDAPLHAEPTWYLENVLPTLQSYGVAAIAPFSHRLSFEDVPLRIQQLQCKVNFEALRFVKPIVSLGEAVVSRLRRQENDQSKPNKFVALHLRFDKDMAAHSACDFGGGRVERLALAYYRQKMWQGRVPNARLSTESLRVLGKCPLTPEEAGLTLAALGFSENALIYLASYKVYGGEPRLSFLKTIFPRMHDKTSLLTPEEMKPVKGKASLLAAVDYYVCLRSDFFFSASPGNMHNAMIGHRTYQDVQKTLRADMVLLSRLFANQTMEWREFKTRVSEGHKSRVGQVRLRKPKQSIYTYPAPDCMCKSNSKH